MTDTTPVDYRVDAETGCWVWQRYIDTNGYARFTREVDGEHWAHRVFYAQRFGPIPEALELDHVCVNPPCVNPDHLDAVTKVEHVRRTWERTGRFDDCLKAGNLRRDGLTYAEIAEVLGLAGKSSAWATVQSAIKWGLVAEDELPKARALTPADRTDIRALHDLGVNQTQLGKWYGVDSSAICRTVKRDMRR